MHASAASAQNPLGSLQRCLKPLAGLGVSNGKVKEGGERKWRGGGMRRDEEGRCGMGKG